MHGVGEFYRHSTVPRRVFWILIVIVCSALGLVFCVLTTIGYTAVPSATRIQLKRADRLRLPKIVVCPNTSDAFDAPKLLAYLHERFPNVSSDETFVDLAAYMLVGSGFKKQQALLVRLNSTAKLRTLARLYAAWRGERTTLEFFHYFFDTFGYGCRQLFHTCTLGKTPLDCCETFKPFYTMRRGRCFAQIVLEQTLPDEFGKLLLLFRKLPSLIRTGEQSALIIHVSDYVDDIAPFPRYFLHQNTVNKMRFEATHIYQLPTDYKCQEDESNECHGRGTCYLLSWYTNHVHYRFNCSLPYWLMETRGSAICEPGLIVQHYKSIMDHVKPETIDSSSCIPLCDRWEYRTALEMVDFHSSTFGEHLYHLEASYVDLEFNELREVKTITVMGFISQIGGQIGLFLGGSLISIFQLLIFCAIYLKRRLKSPSPTAVSNEPPPAVVVNTVS